MQKLFFLPIIISLIACESTQDYKMGYSGSPNEIVVVTSQEQWSGKIGTTVQKYFADYETVLPQPERKFWIINVDEENFGSMFQTHRNVMIVDIAKGKEAKIEFKKSLWAKEQLMCKITAGSDQEFVTLMEERGSELAYRFHEAELARQVAKNVKFGSVQIGDQLFAKHKLRVTAQKDSYIATDSSNFIWIRLEREQQLGGFQHQISQGILIYYYDYKDTLQLSPSRLVNVRDSITKINVPGPSEGSYMSISTKGELPEYQPINFKGNYAVQIKGLWRMENNFMGGPFISITTIDTLNHRVVTAEGYVFAPQFKKRDYLYEVEAVIKSLEFK
ncbi:MAG: DUF4837 family protein [Flavobacteriales bacterium]|nr:DUF4837 family protein [Flavobacteriales bacterium]